MTTYNPRSVFQSYEQYGRAKTKQAQSSKSKNANQQAARTMSSVGVGGLGGRTTTSAAQKIQDRFRRETQRDSGSTYDEVPQTITTGLGSKKIQDTKDESMSVGTKIDRAFVKVMTSLIPDFSPPKEQAVFPLEVYGGPLFRVPTPTPVNIKELDDAARDTSRTFSPTAMEPPTLPTTATDSDVGLTTPRGLMSPPTMTQPEKPKGLMGIPRALARANAVPTAAYQVQSGDTLSEIAAATGTTVKELADLNQISDVDVIEAGVDIQIPIKRLEDEAVVTQATSMEELKPIKASYTLAGAVGSGLSFDPDSKFYESFRQGVTESTHSGKMKSKDEFLKIMIPVAKNVAEQTGLDYRMIVAQAAIETGWGSKVKGNAFFGIKGHGAKNTIDFKTQEEVDGKRVTKTDTFRAYENVGEAASDYGQFLQNNPRYAEYLAATNLEDAAAALQASGYATDSKYGEKVLTTARGRTLRNFLERNPEYK